MSAGVETAQRASKGARLMQGAKPPEFACAADLLAHYHALNGRMARAVPPPRTLTEATELQRVEAPRRVAASSPPRSAPPRYERILTPSDRIREAVAWIARFHGLTPAEITGTSRSRRVIHAKWDAIIALYHAFPTLPHERIARAVGAQDHSCVMHALRLREVPRIGGAARKGAKP